MSDGAERAYIAGGAIVGAGMVLSAALVAGVGLFEIPRYVSQSKVQFKTFDAGKSIAPSIVQAIDELDTRDVMDRSLAILNSDLFQDELANFAQQDTAERRLVLSWGQGIRMRLAYARKKLGLGEVNHENVKLNELSKVEVASLLLKMVEVQPDYKDKTATVSISALDALTAQQINYTVVKAFISANEKLRADEEAKFIEFLSKQREDAQRKLVAANESLQVFYAQNPELVNTHTQSNLMESQSETRAQREKMVEQLEANRKLLAFYREKYMNFTSEADSTAEVYNKFKQDLIELKYQRKKYIFEGYDEKNDGIVEIDRKIADIEKILSNTGAKSIGISNKRLVSIGHEQNISQKILELQDSLKKQQFEIESLDSRLNKTKPKAEAASKSLLALENLRREVRLATELFEELSKKFEYAHIRKNNDERQITLKESPSFPQTPVNVPRALRIFFAFFIGVALAISWLILHSISTLKITDWQSVEDMGLNFAGTLRDYDPDLSEILLNLNCLDSDTDAKTPIVLCASPQESVRYEQVLLLTNYLARQDEKSLFVLVGDAPVHTKFDLVSDLGFAKVYVGKNSKEFFLQVTDKSTIKSLPECIEILEKTYSLKYACVFLLFVAGINDPNYHVGLKLASKVLLLGAATKYNRADYFRLLFGLKDTSNSNLAFVEMRGRDRRMSAPTRRDFADDFYEPARAPKKSLKSIFFD